MTILDKFHCVPPHIPPFIHACVYMSLCAFVRMCIPQKSYNTCTSPSSLPFHSLHRCLLHRLMSRARETALTEAIQDVPSSGASSPGASVTVATRIQPDVPKGTGAITKRETKVITLQENKPNTDVQGPPLAGQQRRSPDNEEGNERD